MLNDTPKRLLCKQYVCMNIYIEYLDVIHVILKCDDAICWQQQLLFFFFVHIYFSSNITISIKTAVFVHNLKKKERNFVFLLIKRNIVLFMKKQKRKKI